MKWHIYISGKYLGTVEGVLGDIVDSLKSLDRQIRVWDAGHCIEVL